MKWHIAFRKLFKKTEDIYLLTVRGAAWKLAISFYRVGSPGIAEDEALENETPNLELDGIRDTFFKSQKL